jgi:nitroreductase
MSGPISIQFDDERGPQGLLNLLYRRHSVRAYRTDPISVHRLRDLLDAAVHAPTAMHQEPWQFLVVQDRGVLKKISDRAKQIANQQAALHGNLLKPSGAAGDGTASPFADPAFNIFYDAGTLVVICAKPTNDFVVADCWMAAENLMLAASADGLGTCCVGDAVAALNAPDVKADLSIPPDIQAIAPIIMGVPVEDALETARRAPVVLNWVR